jgi:hypothetical protein
MKLTGLPTGRATNFKAIISIDLTEFVAPFSTGDSELTLYLSAFYELTPRFFP